jgi:hypothetical protein
MSLHHELHQLVTSMGRRVLSDSEELRAALDDYLPESATTSGEINLLVDAVRLGAFDQMQRMLAEGAAPPAAVGRAGEMLAYDRGSADRDGASWACAVLGYAAGMLPEAEVLRRREAMPQPWQAPSTGSGSAPPQPQMPPPAWPGIQDSPQTAAAPQEPAGTHALGEPSFPTGRSPTGSGDAWRRSGAVPSAAPAGRRRTWLVVGVVSLLVALTTGGIIWALADDQDGREPGAGGEQTSGPSEPTEPTSQSSPTSASSSTPPTATTQSTKAAPTQSPVPQAAIRTEVSRTLSGYLDAINDKDFDRTMSWVSEEIRADSSREQWYDDFATTYDDRLAIGQVDKAGDVVRVSASFRSRQDPGYGPEGAEDATCLLWSIDYEMTWVGDRYVISDASGRGDPPWMRCD